jgi:hypothetical protein
MELVEVHVVGLEAPQAAVDGLGDLPPVEPGRLAAYVVEPVGGTGRLGGQDDPIAPAAGGEPFADDLLGAATGLPARRGGIHLGGIDEIDAPIQGIVHLLEALGLAVLLAPGHGAQADDADLDVAAAQSPVLHWRPLSFSMIDCGDRLRRSIVGRLTG